MKVQTQSTIRPEKYSIENIEDSKCTVLFFDNIEEKQDEEGSIIYIYDMYDMQVSYRESLEEQIKTNLEKWLEEAKIKAYEYEAKKVREIRNKLLEETDKEMCIDRLNIELPEDLTMTNLISGLKKFFMGFSEIFNGDMAKYRQKLRDITKQDGFPYNIKFPIKPSTKDKEE